MVEAQQINPPGTGIAGGDLEHLVFQNEHWAQMTPMLLALCAGLVVLGLAACMLLSARRRTPAVQHARGAADGELRGGGHDGR